MADFLACKMSYRSQNYQWNDRHCIYTCKQRKCVAKNSPANNKYHITWVNTIFKLVRFGKSPF